MSASPLLEGEELSSLEPAHSVVLMVEGMRCASCAIAVEARLKRQANVSDAAVNFAADIAMISWQDKKPDINQLKRAVARLGYQLHTSIDPKRSAEQALKMRKQLQLRLAVAVVFGMWSMMPAILLYLAPFGTVEPEFMWPLALASGLFAFPVLVYSASHFYRVGWRTFIAGSPGLDSLITLAVWAAVIISCWRLYQGSAHVYFDAAVMLITFQLVARLLDTSVRRRASEVVRRYLQDMPARVQVLDEHGNESTLAIEEVTLGQRIRLNSAQQLALDGVVETGSGQADLSLLTGEHEPQMLNEGDELLAGCTLIEGCVTLIVTATQGERRIDRLSQSISRVLSKKTALQQLTDRIARWLIPTILIAGGLAIALSLFQGLNITQALGRAVAVLIVSCPCALSLAIPLVITMGHARMINNGIILRDPAALETAADSKVVVFDKTGTLTTDTPSVSRVIPTYKWTEPRLLQLAASIMQDSVHPVAKGLHAYFITNTASAVPALNDSGERQSLAGLGTQWHSAQGLALAGRATWLAQQGVDIPKVSEGGMQLHLSLAGEYAGCIEFEETLRPEAVSVLRTLQARDYAIYLLSGDTAQACSAIASRLNIPSAQVLAERSPEQKHRFIEALERKTKVCFVGDGLNDGLALAAAGLGIAVGQANSATGLAAAIYLPNGIEQVPTSLRLAKRARKLMYENLFWALAYNGCVIPMAIIGWIHPVIAAVAMSLSSLCVLLNSARMQGETPYREET
ncbi:heavy metal translocating P-type ATPase [Oceanisphaera avium]|uniref:heavy metal translocating P-type ATPase n=1 Tax=Oceanisphaera avium TaxID=1903694 RepID=UPI0018E014BB|nr:cation-translocating P-type ATPase [Oceanisphaera avium]